MIFDFLKKGVTKKELDVLQEAEKSIGFSLVDTYRKLPKKNRKIFLALAENYNREHSEYLKMESSHTEHKS